jgi:hypothetical protein
MAAVRPAEEEEAHPLWTVCYFIFSVVATFTRTNHRMYRKTDNVEIEGEKFGASNVYTVVKIQPACIQPSLETETLTNTSYICTCML